MRIAKTEIIVQAPIDSVWEILIGLDAYAVWNPFIHKIESDARAPLEGGKMCLFVNFEKGRKVQSKEVVTVFEPPEGGHARWGYQFEGLVASLGMIKATRYQILERQANRTTLYKTYEEFTGWGRGLVPLAQVQKGFEAQARALKKASERLL